MFPTQPTDMNTLGKYISIEGRDGVGKTSVIPPIAARLAENLGDVIVRTTREPGGTPLGLILRERLLHDKEADTHPTARAEVLLFAADNAQHAAQVVRPALENGQWVITDRSLGSALAYQGYGRQWGVDVVRSIYSWAIGGCIPHLTILLDCDDEIVKQRLLMQGEEPDNIESSGNEFFQRVANGYRELAKIEDTWATVDCSGDVTTVADMCYDVICERLGDSLFASPD